MSYQDRIVAGYRLGDLKAQPVEKLPAMIRKVAAEGCVLLKNDTGILPLKKGEKVALFGRTQCEYVKSGTGSGGLVNVLYVSDIRQGLRESGHVEVNEELCAVYDEWLKDHPFDAGHGWATEPWSQVEMPLTEEIVAKAKEQSETAIIFIGRTAGEDRDHKNEAGSYLLSEEEILMVNTVKAVFDRVVVVFNVGAIMDTSWCADEKIQSVLYVWQGGMEGGRAASDVLTGKVNPSGKLADTIAWSIEDYPSHANFGDTKKNEYQEDIYVGYRYFETVAKDRVQYPFGFGLSYTTFETTYKVASADQMKITIEAMVKNTGAYAGKEVVEVYYEAPQGKLGQPLRQLAGFVKTGKLKPGQEETVSVTIDLEKMASYDDSGVTGYKSCYVMEQGEHCLYAGSDVRSAQPVFKAVIPETMVVQYLNEAMAPVTDFTRMHPEVAEDGTITMNYEPVPKRTVDQKERIREGRMPSIPYTGDRGIRLKDVADGKAGMKEFVAQLGNEELCCLIRGEGMSSPKVTPGTGSAFGGLTPGLQAFGIPAICTTDGPSGIRMDNGAKASSLPNGTLLACTFNEALVQELYVLEGVEMFAYKIDALLGPGMNIHRHPLCGRNFEYFSEDPLLTGKMAAAMSRGIHETGCTSTLKHFACNNQEDQRHFTDSIVSERALREIYLKGYEIAVKEGGATSIMTSYNLINGMHSASNYDLTTQILREEWGYTGFVMTDWWARTNDEGGESVSGSTPSYFFIIHPGMEAPMGNLRALVIAQNDTYMVTESALTNYDNLMPSLEDGTLTRGDLQRCAINILNYAIRTPAFERYLTMGQKLPQLDDANMETKLTLETVENEQEYEVTLEETGDYILRATLFADVSPLAQSSATAYFNGDYAAVYTINGANIPVTATYPVTVTEPNFKFTLKFNAEMMQCLKIEFLK